MSFEHVTFVPKFKSYWCLTWIQSACKLYSCIPCVLWVLLLFQKFKQYWCLTWIQQGCKLCSCIPCVLWVLSMLLLFQKFKPYWYLTWIQPECKFRYMCTDFQFNTISSGCQIGFKQDVSFGYCSLWLTIRDTCF